LGCKHVETHAPPPKTPFIRLLGGIKPPVISRHGALRHTPGFDDFVDHCMSAASGVILDWGPVAFPATNSGLCVFRRHDTCMSTRIRARAFSGGEFLDISIFGRQRIRSFHVRALFWSKKYHIAGLRVDAVASMLYLGKTPDTRRMDPQSIWRPGESRGHRLLAHLEPVRVYRDYRA